MVAGFGMGANKRVALIHIFTGMVNKAMTMAFSTNPCLQEPAARIRSLGQILGV